MSKRSATNVKLPENLTRWFFEYTDTPLSFALSELLQVYRSVAEDYELYAHDEVMEKMKELLEPESM